MPFLHRSCCKDILIILLQVNLSGYLFNTVPFIHLDSLNRPVSESTPAFIGFVKKDAFENPLVYIRPRGFQNVKNSCYLNASLQLLFQIPQFCGVLNDLRQTKPNSSTQSDSTQKADSGASNRLLPLM